MVYIKKRCRLAVGLLIIVICLTGCGTHTKSKSVDYLPDEYLNGNIGTSQIIYEDGDLYSSNILAMVDDQGYTLTYRDGEMTITEAEEGTIYDSIGMTGQEFVSFVETTKSYITKNEKISTFSIYVIALPEMLSQVVPLDSDVLLYSISENKITSGKYDTETAMSAIANNGHYCEILSYDLEAPIIMIVQ